MKNKRFLALLLCLALAAYAQANPNKAYSPSPGNGVTVGLDPNDKVLLSWLPGANAYSHDVYFGGNEGDVNLGTGGTFKGNQPATNWYTPVLGLVVDRYWRIDEHVPIWPGIILLADGFEGIPWNDNWDDVGSSWFDEIIRVHNGARAAGVDRATGAGPFTFTSNAMNASDACAISVDFYFQKDQAATFTLEYYGSGGWSTPVDLDALGGDDVWLQYTDTTTDSNYFVSNFKLRFNVTFVGGGIRSVEVDDVLVEKATSENVFKGDVWEFTTDDYLTVDDFESYVDDADLRNTWTSGVASDIYLVDGAMEVRHYYIFSYDEAGRTPADADWTREGVKSLSVSFKGDPNNSAVEMYVRLSDGSTTAEVNYPGSPYDMKIDEWKEFNVDLEDFHTAGVDLNSVTNITIGLRGGSDTDTLGYPAILVDDIRLYQPRCVPEHRSVADIAGSGCVVNNEDLAVLAKDWRIGDYNVATSAPPDVNRIAHYRFEGNFNDSSANALHGTAVGDATTVSDAERGNVLKLDGNGDYVDCGNDPNFDLTSQMTVAAWIKVNVFSRDKQAIVTKGDDTWRLERYASSDSVKFGHNGLTTNGIDGSTNVADGEWHHIAGVYDGSKSYVYVDGALDNSIDVTGNIAVDTSEVYIGENVDTKGRWFDGLIDEVRIYDYGLSQAEIAYLADDMAKPDDVANDGYKYVPVLSDAELYSGEARDSRSVNYRDLDILTDEWLLEQLWP